VLPHIVSPRGHEKKGSPGPIEHYRKKKEETLPPAEESLPPINHGGGLFSPLLLYRPAKEGGGAKAKLGGTSDFGPNHKPRNNFEDPTRETFK